MGRGVVWQASIIILFLVLTAEGVRAGEDEGGDENVSLEETRRQNAESLKESVAELKARAKFVGDHRVSEADAKLVIAHYASYIALIRDKGDDAPEERLWARYRKTGEFDYSILLTMEEYKQWTAKKDLDGKTWLRRALRVMSVHQRKFVAELLEPFRKDVQDLEEMAARVNDERLTLAAEEMRWILTLSEKTVQLIPAPTSEEEKVFKKHTEALDALFGDDEEATEEE